MNFINKIIKSISPVLYMIMFLPLNGMFTQFGRRASQSSRLTRPTAITIQKRTIATPHQLKATHKPLTSQEQQFSPVLGAAEWESGRLPRMWDIEKSTTPTVQLVQELFYKQGAQFRPTVNKSKAAYALSPDMIGLILSALATYQLTNSEVRKYIINQLRDEYASLTGDKRPFSETKINNLLNVIIKADMYNHQDTRAILLGFLYTKVSPDNNHEMMHYLMALKNYIHIFTQENDVIADNVKQIQQNKNVTQQPEKSFLTRLASMMNALKKYFTTSADNPSPTFTQQEHAHTISQLQIMSYKKAQQIGNVDFESAIAAIINEKQLSSAYPRMVFQSAYGYKGQPRRANCVEAAMQDLLDIFIYNQITQKFDLYLLPASLHLNSDFKKFYEKWNSIDTINSKDCGQEFMNLISGIDGVNYVHTDYELQGSATKENFLKIMNHFFGIHAPDLTKLGEMLSDHRRTVSFTASKPSEFSQFNFDSHFTDLIVMDIKNNQTMQSLQAFLLYRPGHGELEVPARDQKQNILDLLEHSDFKDYKINPEIKALFDIQPSFRALNMQYMPSSMYYSFPAETDNQKIIMIEEITSNKTIDREALEYAYNLYNQLSEGEKTYDLLVGLIRTILRSGHWTSFKEFLRDHYKIALKESLILMNQGNFANTFIIQFYDILPDNDKKDFFANIMSTFVYRDLSFNIVDIAKQLIAKGVNIAANPDDRRIEPPLFSAISIKNADLVDLLLATNNDSINMMYNDITPLGLAVRYYPSPTVTEKLLQYGADPNIISSNPSHRNLGQYPIFDSIINTCQGINNNHYLHGEDKFSESISIIKLLIQHGANVNCIVTETFPKTLKITPLDYLEIYQNHYLERKDLEKKHKIDQLIELLLKAGAKHYSDLAPEQPFTETKEHLVTE